MPRTIACALAVVLPAAVAGGCGSGTAAPARLNATVRIVGAKPAGGAPTLDVRKGGRVHLVVRSDTADEIHVHGYDIHRDVARNGSAAFDFAATIDGQFVVELERHKQEIATLRVQP